MLEFKQHHCDYVPVNCFTMYMYSIKSLAVEYLLHCYDHNHHSCTALFYWTSVVRFHLFHINTINILTYICQRNQLFTIPTISTTTARLASSEYGLMTHLTHYMSFHRWSSQPVTWLVDKPGAWFINELKKNLG